MNALKRNISSDAAKDPPIKKPKTRKPLDTRYETPHPSALSESQVFKLPSSVGPYLSPSKFSPIPKVSSQRAHRQTSSTNLKENASVLYSPFPKGKHIQNHKKYGKAAKRATKKRAGLRGKNGISCEDCSSSASSPDSHGQAPTLAEKINNSNISRTRVSQSTNNSPTESPTRIRRPSAPTPPKKSEWKNYVMAHTVSSVDLRAPIAGSESRFVDPNDFIRPSPNHSQLNFNRPPSQLSLYDYNCSGSYNDDMDVDDAASTIQDAFFTDVRGTSTPFKNLGSLSVANRRFGGTVDPASFSGSAFLQKNFDGQETDTDNDSCGFDSDEDMDNLKNHKAFRSLKLAAGNKSRCGSGYITPADDSGDEMCRRSPWISDSLISPPKTIDWKLLPKQVEDDAYKQEDSGDDMVTNEKHRNPERVLPDLFNNMILDHTPMDDYSPPCDDTGSHCARLPLHTRSLDTGCPSYSDQDKGLFPVAPGARRTRSGTIIQGSCAVTDAASNAPTAIPRRTRSGTVIPGTFGPPGTAPNNDEKQDPLGTALSAPGRRTRSGTVVYSSALAPSLPIVEERTTGSSSSTSPVVSRRARSGSIMTASSIPEGVLANSTASVALRSARIRSGSVVALGHALASLPNQATGMMKRARSGTVVRAPAAPESMTGVEPAVEQAQSTDDLPESLLDAIVSKRTVSPRTEDFEITVPLTSGYRHPAIYDSASPSNTKSPSRSPQAENNIDDPINLLEPIVFSSSTYSSPTKSLTLATDANAAFNTRSSSGLRARARAAASKAKGLSKNLTGKAGAARGRVLLGPEAGAAALARAKARADRRSNNDDFVNEEDLSDDELLLK